MRRRLGLRDALRRAGQTALERGCAAVTIGGDLYEHDRAGAAPPPSSSRPSPPGADARSCWPLATTTRCCPGPYTAVSTGPPTCTSSAPPSSVPMTSPTGSRCGALRTSSPPGRATPSTVRRSAPTAASTSRCFTGPRWDRGPRASPSTAPSTPPTSASAASPPPCAATTTAAASTWPMGCSTPAVPNRCTFDESEARGAVLVEIAGDGTVSYEALADNRWHARTTRADVSTARSLADVVDAACSAAAVLCAGLDGSRTMLRVDLVGEIDHSVSTDAFTVETSVRDGTGAAGVRVRDFTTRPSTWRRSAARVLCSVRSRGSSPKHPPERMPGSGACSTTPCATGCRRSAARRSVFDEARSGRDRRLRQSA